MIFIDRSIPRSVARALQKTRSDVRWLEDEFPHDAPDPYWLREVGLRGWMVISRDKNIRIHPAEHQEILDNNVGCFILAARKVLSKEEILASVQKHLPEMERLFSITPRPFIFTIDSAGQFRQYR